ncbi:hypothetical protein ACFVUW_00715 [Streptomyces xiamenensis]|uniref:hypothetical protein n=1 Tax=Streptomyces xiamenensis TaxID=408015 RepID=UPI0036E8EA69
MTTGQQVRRGAVGVGCAFLVLAAASGAAARTPGPEPFGPGSDLSLTIEADGPGGSASVVIRAGGRCGCSSVSVSASRGGSSVVISDGICVPPEPPEPPEPPTPPVPEPPPSPEPPEPVPPPAPEPEPEPEPEPVPQAPPAPEPPPATVPPPAPEPEPAPQPAPGPEPEPDPEPKPVQIVAGPPPAGPERPDHGMPMTTRTLLILAPAVLAAAILRPRTRPGARGTS